MVKAFTKRKYGIINIFLLLVILFSCNANNRPHIAGVQLNEFVVNKDLDSTLDYVFSNLKENYTSTIVLELMKLDTIQSIDISLQDKDFIDKYIYYYNRRVVGFTKKRNDTIIILSNIDCLYDLGFLFSAYLYPQKKKDYIQYLHIPLSQYEDISNYRTKSDSFSYQFGNWADIPYMYEPFVFSFRIKDKKICYPPETFRR